MTTGITSESSKEGLPSKDKSYSISDKNYIPIQTFWKLLK